MENKCLNALKQNKKVIGTFVEINGRGIIESLASSGLDFCILDAEHSPLSSESLESLIQTSLHHSLTPFVRIPEISRAHILKSLDSGAQGLIIPFIDTVEQVKEMINLAKFAPLGNRGYCPTINTNFVSCGLEYMKECNQTQLIIPQCETLAAYQNIDEIVNLEGVDGIFVGPLDLSIALSIPFELDSPILKNAIKNILDSCKKAHKLSFIFAASIEKAREYHSLGFDGVAYSLDVSVLTNAYNEIINHLR